MASTLEDWRTLLESGIDIGDYSQAIQHYTNLKNKMLDQFRERVIQANGLNKYSQLLDSIETTLLENASEFSQLPARTILSRLEDSVISLIENDDLTKLRSYLSEIRTYIQQNSHKIKDTQQYLKNWLNQHQSEIFMRIGKDRNFIINMLNVGDTSGDINALANQASSYFIRFLYTQLFDDKSILTSNFKYIMSMSGFYKELAEYEALEKILSEYINVVHAGDIKVGGKDTEMDIFITGLANKIDALNRNAKVIELVRALPTDGDINILQDQLLNDIEWFGEQIKSSSLGSSDVFKIGSRAELYATFESSAPTNKYSTLESAQFLAQFKNILLSLGVSNVLFSQNKKRQWMADFISDFRNQNYVLTFFRPTNKSPLTNMVALQQLYIRGKRTLKRRFAT